MGPFDQVPGLAQAIEEERTNRDLALMDTLPVCGMPCRQVSIKTLVLLRQFGNAFIIGGAIPGPEHVAVFLWMHSPDYCLNEKARLRFVEGKVWPLMKSGRFAWCVMEIMAHLKRSFQDSPGGSGGGKEYVNPGAGIVDFLASEYGWTDDHILNLPIARVFLYQKAARIRRRPDLPRFNPSDGLISQWLRERMQPAPASN